MSVRDFSSRPDPLRLPTSYCTRKVAQEDPTASADTRNTSSPLDLNVPRVVAVAVVRVADGQRERLQLVPRRVGVERGPVVGVEIGTAGRGRRHARIVGDVLRDARRRHVIGVGVIAEARAEPPVGGRVRRQVQVGREHVRLGIRVGARQRNRRQRRIDRERLQRLVVAPQAVGEEPGDLGLVRQLGVAAEADRLRRVRRPQRHAAASRRARRVVEAQRAVPDERGREIVEPRSAVGDAQHVLRVRPLGADREVVGPRVVGQRHLDVVAEAEAGAPRQLAAVLLRGEAGRDVELRRRRGDDVDASDVAPLAQLELRRDRDVGVEARRRPGRRAAPRRRAPACRRCPYRASSCRRCRTAGSAGSPGDRQLARRGCSWRSTPDRASRRCSRAP